MIEGQQKELHSFCQQNGIRRLALFGSRLRGDHAPDADIDLLAEFEPGVSTGLLTIARLERELSDLLGAPVDLRTEQDLSRHFRDDVTGNAKPIFEAA